METSHRSFVKALGYRLVATTLVFVIAFVYTGRLGSSVKVGLSAAVAKALLYSLWERLWAQFEWGVSSAAEDIE
jgi:uncharacterized membrane protein